MIGSTGNAAQSVSEADLVRFGSEILSTEPLHELTVNEARFGLSRLLPILSSLGSANAKVLEVGAGSCLLSAYLASKGLYTTALEPLAEEFEFLDSLQSRVLEFCRLNGIALTLKRATGEELDVLEQFDVAFTINALEHMRDPLQTLDNMYRSLAPGGVLLAHCPNYTIPFDPHFNILMVTRSKPLNEWLYRSKIKKYPSVWEELNFIRYVDLRRHMSRRGWSYAFDKSVVRDSIMRLMNDPIFARRMPRPIRAIASVMRSSGVVHILSRMPPRLQTPMEVLTKKPDILRIQ